jgi:hypothetical protein
MEVQDPALAGLDHAGDHRLGQVERGVHVHLEGDHAPPQREVHERLVDRRRRVVHQHVDRPTQRGLGLGHHPGPVVGIREVGHDHAHRRTRCPQVCGRLLEAAGQVVVLAAGAGDDGHVSAVGRHPPGDGRADAPACAGDQDTSACEPLRACAHARCVRAHALEKAGL